MASKQLTAEVYGRSNRRRFSRVRCHAPVALDFAGGSYRGGVVDLSLRGALIAVPDLQWRGAGVEARLCIEDTDSRASWVMRVEMESREGPLFGCRCTHLDPADLELLAAFLKRRLASPELIARELQQLG
ncbi:MAG: PilZ domain-containing protein [Pseudomonadota bacterium]|nr:PilZ domain-containing protein [Pseudomonadota bacterium]